MGLRLVYGLKTDDPGYLSSFYPSRRLAEAAASLGIDYAATVLGPHGSVDEALRFCEGHVALLRGELPAALGERLTASLAAVVNPPVATALADDKLATAAFLAKAEALHPATAALPSAGDSSALGAPLPFPFVCKPRYGRMGRGLRLVEDEAAWKGFLSSGLADSEPYLAQDYVSTSRGRDLRFFFADFAGGADLVRDEESETADCVVVERRGAGLESNAHRGGAMTAFAAPPGLFGEARRLFALSGLSYGTVDFLFGDDDSFYVCELNASPGFEALEAALGIDVAAAILRSAIGANRLLAPGRSYPRKEARA